jgi:hypothetical protein
VALVAIGSLRIISTYHVFSHTIDEPDHLAAGAEYLTTAKYWYEDQHPPLARVFGAVGPVLAGERFHHGPDWHMEGYRILGHGSHYDRILALGRAGILPFFWLGCWVVYRWALRDGGPVAAVGAVLIFSTLPPVLAHAGLITTDLALASLVGAAALATLYWADKPDRRHSIIWGAAIGLACLAKFSALAFLPAAWAVMLIRSDFRRTLKQWRMILVALGAAWIVIWAGYRFGFAHGVPAPHFFSGIQTVWRHNQNGHAAYVLGRRSQFGFWYFYPVVLGVKTPMGLLGLTALGLLTRRAKSFSLLFAGAILAIGLASRINIGVRHILPVYLGMSVFGGCVVASARGRVEQVLALGLLGWLVVSSAAHHPDYLAYTNEIAGSHPENFVADSDLDWGQDMNRLADFLSRSGIQQITFRPFNWSYQIAGHPLPVILPPDSEKPSPGWNAVSITTWKVFGFPAWTDRARPPSVRVGRSILLWRY